ncbi:MAG: cytochrome c family protein [Myxococcales bacterium]|nr:cytochrome c family protein [Myxococcales bacterium]
MRAAWLLVLTCVAALGLGLSVDSARAEGPGPARREPAAPLATVHGLAPLPGNAQVPLADRPPGAEPGDGGPSPVIFPPQQLTLRFNHKKHVKELGLTCTTCHDAAKTSRSSADSLLPKATRCDACHGSDHRDLTRVKTDDDALMAQCGFCHLGYKPTDGNRVARMVVPKPNLRMNHAVHASRNIACSQCHGAVENIELATRDQLPRMKGCFSCHQMPGVARGRAKGECVNCHLTERGGLMKTRFGSGTLKPPRWLGDSGHGADWVLRHKQVAGSDSQLCASCHQERFCTDCHDGRVRPRAIHPNDWISMHPVAARQNDPSCTSCHRQQTFCVGCHQRAGVAMSGPYANFAGRGRFHPPPDVWSNPPRSSQHHAWEAQRNINACASCHVERDCATCHATPARGGRGFGPKTGPSGLGDSGFGGQGVNPHPRNFRDRCAGALRKNARPCLVCHDPADPKLQECR